MLTGPNGTGILTAGTMISGIMTGGTMTGIILPGHIPLCGSDPVTPIITDILTIIIAVTDPPTTVMTMILLTGITAEIISGGWNRKIWLLQILHAREVLTEGQIPR